MALEGAREIVVYKRKNATFLSLKSYFDQVAAQTGCLIRVWIMRMKVSLVKISHHQMY